MKNNFSDFSEILKYIVEVSGKDVLRDKKKTCGMINDLAPGDKFNAEKKLLNDAYSFNAVRILFDADNEAGRHLKAVGTAKEKLTNNYIAPDGADVILKAVCCALGWDIQDLFPKPSVPNQKSDSPVLQPAKSEQNRLHDDLNRNGQEAVIPPQLEPYSQVHGDLRAQEQQPVAPQYSQPYNNMPPTEPIQQAYSQPIQIIQQEKKSPLTTLLKITALIALIVIVFAIVKKDDNNDKIITETQAAVAETSEQITESLTEVLEQVTDITTTAIVQTSAESTAALETTTTSFTTASDISVTETLTTEPVVEAVVIPETTAAETTETTQVTTITTTATTVTTTAETTSAQVISDGIDWVSIPYANEEDFRIFSYENFDPNKPIYLDRYNGSEKIVKIPLQMKGCTITAISQSAFADNEEITNVNIPVGITSIGSNAFKGCESLKSVVIPDGVISIGESCFYNCENLEAVNIPESVTKIDSNAFRGCKKLTNVYLPDGIKEIGYSVFTENENIKVTYKGVVYDANHVSELRQLIN